MSLRWSEYYNVDIFYKHIAPNGAKDCRNPARHEQLKEITSSI